MISFEYFPASDVPTGKVTPDIEEKASKFEEFRPQTPDLSRTLEDEELEGEGRPAGQERLLTSVEAKDIDHQAQNNVKEKENLDEADKVVVTKKDERPVVSLEDLKQMIAEKKKSYFDGSSDSNCEFQSTENKCNCEYECLPDISGPR